MAAITLPSVDLGFDNLRDRMARFTEGFDEFIERGRKRLLEEKNEFARNMAEDKEIQRTLRQNLDTFKEKESQIQEKVEKEDIEVGEAERTIADMKRKKQMRDEHKETLMAQIKETQETIRKRRTVRAAERKALSSQSSRNAPELAFWEDYLGMRIDGAGTADHLKIVYTHILDNDWNREFYFVVSMMHRDYEGTFESVRTL
ncbi:hypothetical protein EDC01DRAFT_662528 [Geopyxis carbonaria]|nr:hypothetical protein EDC01DRAFT_662528 [Geopyxis carbonaria]